MTARTVSVVRWRIRVPRIRFLSRAGAVTLRGRLLAGPILLVSMLVFSVVASIVTGDNPLRQNLASMQAPPGAGGHLLGTDQLGRDILAWVAAGIRTSCEVSLSVVGISAVVGTTIGLLAGYVGGWLDAVLMRLADLQLSVPPLPLFIAVSVVVTNNMPIFIMVLSFLGWVAYARLCRTRALALREKGYVKAARLAGRRRGAIILLHLLPGVSTEVLTIASLQASFVLIWEAGLSFLGLGLQPPYVSLGFLMYEGLEVIQTAWWVAVFPGICLVLLVLGFNLLGDGLRDLFSTDSRTGKQ